MQTKLLTRNSQPRSTQNKLLIVFAMTVLLPLSLTAADLDGYTSIDLEKTSLLEDLANAESEQEGRVAEDAIWRFWFNQSPTSDIRASLNAGMERRQAYDYEAAETHLDKVVESAPDYAEGYNQRAFVRFLRENYDDAQSDLDTALALEPDHFGAMSGLYHVLRQQNRLAAAIKYLQLAVDIHPWLKERSALPKSMWSEKYRSLHESGQEI